MRIEVRDARKEDKHDVMSLISVVWGENDYIQKVWDAWITDRNGKIKLAVLDGKIVGLNHYRILPDGYCWLEGVRVHPEQRRKGIATLLGMSAMKEASRLGVSGFRLICNNMNKPAINQVRAMGFHEAARYSFYTLNAMNESRLQQSKVPEDLLDEVEENKEYYWDTYTAVRLNKETLNEFLKDGFIVRSKSSVALVKQSSAEDSETTQISYVKAREERFIEELTGLDTKKKIFYLKRGAREIKALRRIGAKRSGTFIIFERNP